MADKNKAPKHRGSSAQRYWQTHSAAVQKPKRIARHKRRMARKMAKLAKRSKLLKKAA